MFFFDVTSVSDGSSYTYDATCPGFFGDGSMLTRVVDEVTTTFAYNADNKLTTVSRGGSTIATFVYDGDGTRVSATINGVTTKFVGEYYEVTGTVVTKFYGGSAVLVDGFVK